MLLSTEQLKERLKNGSFDTALSRLYGDVPAQRARYLAAVGAFEKTFGAGRRAFLLSVPGRTEVAGNHTDHQRGKVLAASVSLDAVAVVSPEAELTARVCSEGYGLSEVDLSSLEARDGEKGTSAALIRGTADGFVRRGLSIGGFAAYVTSDVLSGSGLSSSACFEVLIGTALSYLYNDDAVAPYKIAMIGKYAENVHFGKPCGLMDQMACAVGGLIRIDFADPDAPDFAKIPFEPEKAGYRLCIVDTGGSHADLTDDYAAVAGEMTAVANALGKPVLREASKRVFFRKLPALRAALGDRAVLRAVHFFSEMDRVKAQTERLEKGDFAGFLKIVRAAGLSSFTCNQNAYSTKDVKNQGVVIGLMLCEKVLGKRGAWRLQGGGFAGTIQAYVPEKLHDKFTRTMEGVFGEGAVYTLTVRHSGAVIL